MLNNHTKHVSIPYFSKVGKETVNIMSRPDARIYIMLSEGGVQNSSHQSNNQAQKDVLNGMAPNHRLLEQCRKTLKNCGIDAKKKKFGASYHLGWWQGETRINLVSNPVCGHSYIDVQVWDRFHQKLMEFSLVVQNSTELLHKLLKQHILEFRDICPKRTTCHVICADCPELAVRTQKGGGNV